jgi:hypothetical protein
VATFNEGFSRAEKAAGALKKLQPDIQDVNRHLFALFAPTFAHAHPDAWIEVAYGAPNGPLNAAAQFSIFDLKGAAEFAESRSKSGSNIYIGPALRRKGVIGRAKDEDTITSSFCWAEYDHAGDETRIEALLRERNLRPGIIVTTGTVPYPRRHLYFRIDGNIAPEQLRAMNRGLINLLGSDPAVLNPSRIMRLAGTVSYPKPDKVEKGYISELVSLRIIDDAPAYPADHLIGLTGSFGSNKTNGTGNGNGERKGPRTDDELLALLEASRTASSWHNAILVAVAVMVGRNWSDCAIKLACGPYCRTDSPMPT